MSENAIDFNALMESTWDEGELPEAPEGYWQAELVGIQRDKEDREDKNGDPYRMVRFFFAPRVPEASVDPAAAAEFLEKAGPEDSVSLTKFLRRRRDINGLRRFVKSVGIPEAGSIEETLDSYDGGIVVRVLVETTAEWGSQVQKVEPLTD